MKKSTSRKGEGNAPLGVADFLDFVCDTEPEYSVLAVKAPIEEVASAFKALRKPDRWIRDATCKAAGEDDDVGGGSFAPIVQLRDNPWTVMLRSVFEVSLSDLKAIVDDAKAMSSKLKTQAVTFIGEDTSGAMAFNVFERGKQLEHVEWEDGGSFFSFKSTLRKKPKTDEVSHDFADGVFREFGIYLPTCYAMSKGKKAWVAIQGAATDRIERADLVDLGEDEDDDEDDDE